MTKQKALASVGALTKAKTETFAGSQSDYILAQKVFDSLIKIWGEEHGLTLEVRRKEGKIAV